MTGVFPIDLAVNEQDHVVAVAASTDVFPARSDVREVGLEGVGSAPAVIGSCCCPRPSQRCRPKMSQATASTGLNLAHHLSWVCRIMAVDPNPGMSRIALERRIADAPLRVLGLARRRILS